ncbi:RcnB family protein [uncultured Parasphingorhabdus sp.]|uniref:RcnB family protein n=1 Tax=uncultured Parasphingorhabdus sp. TaxID=2709694 RepID=UPI002AA856E3|nr:RcnB family protein [uncultured Parasphingorhabdus sp.]
MKKTISTLCALALLAPAGALAQKQDQRNDHGQNTQSHSAQDGRQSSQQSGPNSQAAGNKTSNSKTSGSNTGSSRATATPPKSASSSHGFSKGQRFVRSKAPNYRRIDYRQHRQLSAPASGYVWVRAGNDALLVRLSNNLIVRIVANIY